MSEAQENTEAEKQDTTLLGAEGDVAEQTPEEKVVPESYDLKLSEGSLLSESKVDEVSEYAKKLKLSNEEAQDLLDAQEKNVAAYRESQVQELEVKKTEWIEQVKADSDIGGDKFTETLALTKRVLDKFGSDELKDALNNSGLGNHPQLVKFVAKIGRAMSDDSSFGGSPTEGDQGKSAADVLYGS